MTAPATSTPTAATPKAKARKSSTKAKAAKKAVKKVTKRPAKKAVKPIGRISNIWFQRSDKTFVRHQGAGNKPLCATSRFKARAGAKPGVNDKKKDCRMCAAAVKKIAKAAK